MSNVHDRRARTDSLEDLSAGDEVSTPRMAPSHMPQGPGADGFGPPASTRTNGGLRPAPNGHFEAFADADDHGSPNERSATPTLSEPLQSDATMGREDDYAEDAPLPMGGGDGGVAGEMAPTLTLQERSNNPRQMLAGISGQLVQFQLWNINRIAALSGECAADGNYRLAFAGHRLLTSMTKGLLDYVMPKQVQIDQRVEFEHTPDWQSIPVEVQQQLEPALQAMKESHSG